MSEGSLQTDAEDESVAGRTGSSSGSWMTTPPISSGLVGIAVDEFEQGGAEVVENTAEAGAGAIRHGSQHLFRS